MFHYAVNTSGDIVCAMKDKKPVGTFPMDWVWLTTEQEVKRCHEGKLWLASDLPAPPKPSGE